MPEDSPVDIVIVLSFFRSIGAFEADATYFVRQKERHVRTFDTVRQKAISRNLSVFRRRGHGGKSYRVIGTDGGGWEMQGRVPFPRKRKAKPEPVARAEPLLGCVR